MPGAAAALSNPPRPAAAQTPPRRNPPGPPWPPPPPPPAPPPGRGPGRRCGPPPRRRVCPPRGQPAPVQRGEQEVTAAVAGEDPPGPVTTMRGGREAHDEYPGCRVTPAGDRAPPVSLIPEGLAAGGGHVLPPADQPRAGPA